MTEDYNHEQQENVGPIKRILGMFYYLLLPVWEKHGMEKPPRETIKKYIKKLCDDHHITRASLGIIAGVRAELYFNGGWSSVSLDSIGALAEKGTDVVYIEKPGIPYLLEKWADKWGIALVFTNGHLVEYAKDLMGAAKRSGAHVVIMVDYETEGIKIASETPSEIPWIGANEKMLAYFNIDKNKVKVKNTTARNKGYVRYLIKNARHPTGKDLVRSGKPDGRFVSADADFLDKYRVELDAIIALVGAERFFEYIIDTLKELYPKRDYNRAIQVTTTGLGLEHEDAIKKISDTIENITKKEADDIKDELKDTKGFLEVEEERKDIKERLAEALTNNPNYEDFKNKLNELVDSHPFFKNRGNPAQDQNEHAESGS